MKALFTFSIFAAIAVLFAVARLELAASALFNAGMIAIVTLDYGRRRPAPVLPLCSRRNLSGGVLPRVLRTESRRLAA